MRGFFGIGVEHLSKQMNAGNLVRSAHAFGAAYSFREGRGSDTANSPSELPIYQFDDATGLELAQGCRLVGVELSDRAVDPPSFRHPRQAAYVLGPERGSLSPEMTARCGFVVKIPTKFCINVGVAGAIVMYDRLMNLRRFASRPLMPGGVGEAWPSHVFGEPVLRRKAGARRRVEVK